MTKEVALFKKRLLRIVINKYSRRVLKLLNKSDKVIKLLIPLTLPQFRKLPPKVQRISIKILSRYQARKGTIEILSRCPNSLQKAMILLITCPSLRTLTINTHQMLSQLAEQVQFLSRSILTDFCCLKCKEVPTSPQARS